MRPIRSARCVVSAAAQALGAWPFLWAMVAAVAGLFFLIGADSLSSTSRAVLHGLCAQRPSHSFTIGGELLPFDARMTGIYSGALWSWGVLSARGRLLAAATPSVPVIILLGGAVAALGIDGVNALLVDLQLWHPYEPLNGVRYFTGFGTGVAITSLQVWLIGGSLWKLASHLPSWDRPLSLWWTIPAAILTFGAIRIDLGWTYPVLATLLVASAWITVTGLVLVIVVSLLRIESRIISVRRLEAPLIVSAIAALFVIIGLAQLRFWLERTLGIPQDFESLAGGSVPSILVGLFDLWPDHRVM